MPDRRTSWHNPLAFAHHRSPSLASPGCTGMVHLSASRLSGCDNTLSQPRRCQTALRGRPDGTFVTPDCHLFGDAPETSPFRQLAIQNVRGCWVVDPRTRPGVVE